MLPATDVTEATAPPMGDDPRGGRPVGGQPSIGARTAGVGASVRQHPTPRRDRSGPGPRVLVVEDDGALAEMLSLVLRNEGFDPIWCAHGDKALDTYRRARPDLVLLDLMLPGKDGMAICREIRSESPVPIVMLTARSGTVDVVAGLEAGADDYLAKPFKAQELVARIKTRLRHSPEDDHHLLRIGDLVIDPCGHIVTRDDKPISLTRMEFDLLLALARRPKHVFSRQLLLEQVWHFRYTVDTRLVNVQVQRLRAKIERDLEHPAIIVTVRGVGYQAGEPPAAELIAPPASGRDGGADDQ